MISVLTAVGVGLNKAIADQIAYANEVRQLSSISGESAENTSRFIQVLDDYKISSQDALAATRALTNEGHVPSIDTLAKLSDQYLAITDAEKKNEFVIKNLGRGGLQWIEVLNKGSAALLKQGAAVDKSLILTQKMVDDARKAEIAQDGWNDSIQGAKTALSVGLLPALTAVINRFTVGYEAARIFYGALFDGKEGTVGYFEALDQANAAQEEQIRLMMESEQSLGSTSGAIGENSDALKAQEEAVKIAENALNDYKDMLQEVSQANQDAESFMQSYADFQKNYEEEHAAALDKVKEKQFELNIALGNFGGEKKNLSDIEWEELYNSVDDAKKGVQDLEASWHESTNKMIYDMALAKVSVDGLTDAEFAATQDLAVQMGLRTQAQADEAKAMMEKATSIADGIAMQEDVMREKAAQDAELLRLENEKALAAGNTTTAIVDGSGQSVEALGGVAQAVDSATQSYIAMAAAAWDASAAAQAANGASSSSTSGSSTPESVMHSRDSGGQGIAGTPYLIGMGAQPEVFVPSSNGNFIPNADKKFGGSKTINISISNPKGETSENSIRRSLKQVSYLGYAI